MTPQRKTLAVIYLLTYLLIASYEVTRIQQIFVTTFKWTESISLYTGISILALILFFAFASKRFSQFIAILTCILLISTSAKPVIDEINKPPQLEAENTDEYKDIPKSTCASWDKKCLTNHEIEIAPQQQYNNELLERKNAIKKRNKDLLEKGNTTDYQEVSNRILGILFVSIITSFGVYYTAHEFAKITVGQTFLSDPKTVVGQTFLSDPKTVGGQTFLSDHTTESLVADRFIQQIPQTISGNGQACLSTTNPIPTKSKTEKNYPTDEVIIALYKSGRTQESLYKEYGHRKRIEQILAPIKCKDVSRHVPTKTTIIETEPNLFETKQNSSTDILVCDQTTDKQNKNKTTVTDGFSQQSQLPIPVTAGFSQQIPQQSQQIPQQNNPPLGVGGIVIEFKKKAS